MDIFMIWKKILGKFSISCLLLCFAILKELTALPVRCSTKGNAEEVLKTIRNSYIVVENTPPRFVLSNGEQPHSSAQLPWQCHYSFVETKKNPNQIPSSLVTAQCKKDFHGICNPRCYPRRYFVTVLEKDPNCNDKIGQAVWRTKQVPVITGYDMLF